MHARTQQLALLAGRVAPQVSQTDYEQAKREVTGATDPDRQNAVLDADITRAFPEEAQGLLRPNARNGRNALPLSL